jgi:membrane-associated phospholipid phosphatase
MASLVRSRVGKALWTLWPTWVWFAVMATGNHYWLDVAAGVGVALLGMTMVTWFEHRRDPADALVTPRRW